MKLGVGMFFNIGNSPVIELQQEYIGNLELKIINYKAEITRLHNALYRRKRFIYKNRSEHSPISLTKLMQLSNGHCFYCNKKMVLLPIEERSGRFVKDHICRDHVMPLAKGGVNTIDNIVGACMECNFIKDDIIFINYQI